MLVGGYIKHLLTNELKMKRYALILMAVAAAVTLADARTPVPRPSADSSTSVDFVPHVLQPVKMGMPMRQFIRDVVAQAPRDWESSPRGTSWFLVYENQPFVSATLSFSIRSHQLVELKLRFASHHEAVHYAQREIFPRGQPLNNPRDVNTYRLTTRDQMTVDAWVDRETLYLIARLPDPAW